MRNTVRYEWDWEEMDGPGEDADIVDHHHSDRLEPKPCDGPACLVLVRDVGNDDDGLTDRTWAYVKEGRLPERFADAYDRPQCKVPERFVRELSAAGVAGR